MKTLNGYEVVDAKAREEIEALKNAEVDLSDYAKKSELPTKTSQLTNDNRFITLADVPKTDLSDYALKASVPTKISQLTNDKGYITSADVPKTDLSEYAKKDELPESVDLTGYATEKYVDDAIANIELPEGSDVDLSEYAKKTDIPDVSDFISEIPSEYITESELSSEISKTRTWVNTKGYATETFVNEAIAGIDVPEAVDLTGYATETFVTNKIAEAQLNVEDDPIDLSGYATKDDIKNFITEVPSEYVTETELAAKKYLTEHQDISGKADVGHTHPEYLTEHQSLANYATKSDVTGAISQLEQDIIDAGFMTAVEVSAAYARKTDIPDVSKFITDIPSEYVTESELNAKGYLTEHQSLAGLATTQELLENTTAIAEVEARVDTLESDAGKYLTSIPTEYITETELTNKGYITSSEATANYATKNYVDTAIAGIELTGGISGVVSYTFELGADGYEAATDTDKAVANDILATITEGGNAHEKYNIYVRRTNENTGDIKLYTVKDFYFDEDDDCKYLKMRFNNRHSAFGIHTDILVVEWEKADLSRVRYYTNWEEFGNGGAIWSGADSDGALTCPQFSDVIQVRITGRYKKGISDYTGYATFDLCAPDNKDFSYFYTDTDFLFPDVLGISESKILTWRLHAGSFPEKFSLIVDGVEDNNFEADGIYYWIKA